MLKAIDTEYAGCRFRSRTEARWAVFFDALGVRWEYEKEGYELPSGRYLPDFWLPELRGWVEIKGSSPTRDERVKIAELIDASDMAAAIVTGAPDQDRAAALFRCMNYGRPEDSRKLSEAITAAKGARFEFGEANSRQRRLSAVEHHPHNVYPFEWGVKFDLPIWAIMETTWSGSSGGLIVDERMVLDKHDAHSYALLIAIFCGFSLSGSSHAQPH